MRRLLLCIVFLSALAGQGFAVLPDEVLSDPVLEARARAISAELRCMVCQNQSIDDSDAPLARDLRILVRDRLKAGDSDEGVFSYIVERYGEFVLLKPRFAPHTLLLWLAPVLALVVGAIALWRFQRRRRPGTRLEASELSASERKRLERLLSD